MIAYLASIWKVRYFWMALVRNDLRNRYRRSMLGLGWSLLQPIAMTAVLCTVFAGMFNISISEYAPFLFSGLTFWSFVTATMNQGCQSFFQGESYIRQHRAPLAIYPLRTTLGAGYHFLVGLVVVIVFVWIMRGFGNLPALAALLPALALLFVFGWSLAICTGTLNVLFHDTQHLLEIGLQILFYLTPIMYPTKVLEEKNLGWVVQWNPLTVLVELIRQPLLEGTLPSAEMFRVGLMITAFMVVTAALMLRWCERRLVFYL